MSYDWSLVAESGDRVIVTLLDVGLEVCVLVGVDDVDHVAPEGGLPGEAHVVVKLTPQEAIDLALRLDSAGLSGLNETEKRRRQ